MRKTNESIKNAHGDMLKHVKGLRGGGLAYPNAARKSATI